MTLQQLNYFSKAAECQHFSKAAETLNVSQPALSYAIQTLENELNVELFAKDGRNVRLTEYGSRFIVYVNDALRQINNGVAMLDQYKEQVKNQITIACANAMGLRFLPTVLQNFYKENQHYKPNIIVNQVNITHASETAKVKNGTYHMAFGPFSDDPDLEYFALYKETVMLGVSQNHPLAARDEVFFSDFCKEGLITFLRPAHLRVQIENLYRSHNMTPNIAYEVTNEVMVSSMIEMMNGIGLLPVSDYLKYPNIKLIPLADHQIYRQMYAIRANGRAMTSSAQTFWNYVVDFTTKRSSESHQ